MKLTLGAQSLRFRMTEEELRHLLAGEQVREKIMIGGKRLCLKIKPEGIGMSVTHKDGFLGLSVSEEQLQTLHDMGKNKEGLSAHIDGIDISLQVDLRTDSRPRSKPAT